MYSVTIRDHIMIAHSLDDPVFGPASDMHGATYVVDATFFSEGTGLKNVVIDISLAQTLLKETLDPLRYRNLDDLPEFSGKLTTTEFLARYVHDILKEKTSNHFNGRIRITLGESHVAWASYEVE